jgi:hypothetical protein
MVFFTLSVQAETVTPIPSPASDATLTATPTPIPTTNHKTSVSQQANNWAAREGKYYERTWGVDIAGVRRVSSGYMLEFRYRVVDADKAKVFADKAAKPYLIDEASGATFAVPTLEKVGELRQSVKPEAGRTYYMIFGNPGKMVKPGNRVSVVVGKFRADGIIVQ